MELNYMELREQICDVYHKVWQPGWVAANGGNVSTRLDDETFFATPTGMNKSFIAPEKLACIDGKGEVLESLPGYRPSSKIKMHLRCYKEHEDVNSVSRAHPPMATGHAIANVPLDKCPMIETIIALSPIPVAPYGTSSVYEIPNNIAFYLGEHDVILLQYHGTLTVGTDVITVYYRVEILEPFAKTSLNARMLGSAREISRENIDRPISMGKEYGVIGRHPDCRKHSKQGENKC